MTKPKWRAKVMCIVFAFALVFGLSAVIVPSQGTPAGASPGTMVPWTDLKASSDPGEGDNIALGTDADKHSGDWSIHLGIVETVGTSDAYVKIYIGEKGIDMTVAEFASEFSWWVKQVAGSTGKAPYAVIAVSDGTNAEADKLHFEPGYDAADYAAVDTSTWYQFVSSDATTWDTAWYDMEIKGNESAVNNHSLQWFIDNDDSTDLGGANGNLYDILGTDKVTWVQIILNESGAFYPDDTNVYVDDVTCGDTLFPIELAFIPDLGLNVKGAEQCFYLSCAYSGHGQEISDSQVEDITLIAGLLTPADVAESNEAGTVASTVAANTAQICVVATTVGDIHVRAEVTSEDGPTHYVYAEKKWGELHHTVLDVDASTTAVEHEKTVRRTEGVTTTEILKDTVYAEFLELTNPQTAGGALVHWWLFKDTTANQDAINALMDDLAADNGFLWDGYWSATGQYDPTDPPIAAINALHATQHATETEWTLLDPTGAIYTIDATDTYATNVTEDDLPGDVRGTAQATLSNDGTDEDVMIVVLVDYPIDKHGENRICIEKGKKSFTTVVVPPPYLEKVPQVVWAGEKITLEQSWGIAFNGRLVSFQLEHPGLGTLVAVNDSDCQVSGDLVYTQVSGGVARCILDSEDPGQADVKVVLREDEITGEETVCEEVEDGLLGITLQTGLVVYYLKLESITPLDLDPQAVTVDTDVEFGVEVQGWFTSSNLSTRPARLVDLDGDGFDDTILPAGRWILPDDWAVLAGADWETLRPHWDIMDDPDDDITSQATHDEWGPYDSGVNTPAPPTGPGEAEYPVIGPFSLLQPFAAIQWLATASVPADATVSLTGLDLRTTVVPDGELNEWDAPMPPAKVIFNADSDLSGADKGAIYVTAGGAFTTPFYGVEIPATQYIPPMLAGNGYDWDSWDFPTYLAAGAMGPYDFWTDLNVSPDDDEALEVYSDNHGIAYVTIDALSSAGSVTISATADYPYLTGKHGAMKSADVSQTWGEPAPDTIHIDANPFLFVYPGATTDLPEALTNIGPDGLDVVIIVWGTVGGDWVSFDPETSAGFLTELETGEPYVMPVLEGVVCEVDWEMPTL